MNWRADGLSSAEGIQGGFPERSHSSVDFDYFSGEIYCLALVFRLCFFNGHGGLMVDLKAAFPRFREHWARLLGIDGNIQRGGINTAYHRAGHSLFVENGW